MEGCAAEAANDQGAEALWRLSATAVWLEHLCSLKSEPYTFTPAALSWWAASFLEVTLPVILAELRRHQVTLRLAQSDSSEDVYYLAHLNPGGLVDFSSAEDVRRLLAKVCSPMTEMELDWLPSLRQSVKDIAEVLCEAMGDSLDLNQIRETEVSHAVMFNEEWSTPYEISWQADGAGKCITMPDVPSFADRHFALFADRMGHVHPGQTVLYEFLGTFVIPCHEVIHIAQHAHGGLLDADPWSYAMEHDASRLNFVLLWHVLQRREMSPPWARWVIMLDGINRSLAALRQFQEERLHEKYAAYRRWADSFGMDSPGKDFADAGDVEALQLESLSKQLVAGEALAVGGQVVGPPEWRHLVDLVRLALDAERQGDVYSETNRRRIAGTVASCGEQKRPLQLDAGAPDRLFAPAAPQSAVAPRLRAALQAACAEGAPAANF